MLNSITFNEVVDTIPIDEDYLIGMEEIERSAVELAGDNLVITKQEYDFPIYPDKFYYEIKQPGCVDVLATYIRGYTQVRICNRLHALWPCAVTRNYDNYLPEAIEYVIEKCILK